MSRLGRLGSFAPECPRCLRSDLFHRFNTGTHGLATPFIEELGGPGRRVVLPEFLKGFLEQVSADDDLETVENMQSLGAFLAMTFK